MSSHPKTLLVGAGYIGQNVLDELLAAKYPVTVFVRRPEQASVFESQGAQTVLGTLSDLELLTIESSKHEIIINTASCDDLPSVEAILAGVRRRADAGQPVTYLHTSGTGALCDESYGMYQGEVVYRDDEPADIHAIPIESMHRHVDIPIVAAAQELGDKAKIAILLPPLAYGVHPTHKRHSMAMPALTRFALKHGFAGQVGKGVNLWSVVHVRDLGRAYVTVLGDLERSTPAKILNNPFYFAENGTEVSFGAVSRHVGRVLYDLGRIESPEPKPWTDEDYKDLFGPLTALGFGGNSRSRAIRLQDLGWEAKEKDIWSSYTEDEAPLLLAEADSS